MGPSSTSRFDQPCRRCACVSYDHERQPLSTTIPALAKMSKQILDDSIGLIFDPWNWKVRLYGTQSRSLQEGNCGCRKVYQFDSAPPSKRNLHAHPGQSTRIPQPTSKPLHQSKREKKTVHFLEPEHKQKRISGAGHPKFPVEPAKLELYEVVDPANDIPRVIDIDYDTKSNRWCIDEPSTFPDREDLVAMICSKSVLRAMQFADSSTGHSAPASSPRISQFKINQLPNYGVIKNPGGDLATLKASSHDLFHINNLEEFLLHTYEHPKHVFLVNGGQFMKHWLIDLRQLVSVLSKVDTRQKCKSAFWDLVHHGLAEKITLQLWGAGDPQPEVSEDIETLNWATWVTLYKDNISETLCQDIDQAMRFLYSESVSGSSWPAAIHPGLSIMSHKGLTSGGNASVQVCDGMKSVHIESRSSFPSANDNTSKEMKKITTAPINFSTIRNRLSSHDDDGSVRVWKLYSRDSRLTRSKKPLPRAPGSHLHSRTVGSSLGPSSPTFESQESVSGCYPTDLDVPNEEDGSVTHGRALAQVDYGTATGGLVDLNGTASGVSSNEQPETGNITQQVKEPRADTSAYERLKVHFEDQSSHGNTQNKTTPSPPTDVAGIDSPAFSYQLHEALDAKQRLIQSSTATEEDLEKARQGWLKDQDILCLAGLLKRDLRVALQDEWVHADGIYERPGRKEEVVETVPAAKATCRIFEVNTRLAQIEGLLHDLRNQVAEKVRISAENSDAVKAEMGRSEQQAGMVTTRSVLDAVDEESRKLEGTEQGLAPAKDSLQFQTVQNECPNTFAHYLDRPHLVSEGAAEGAESHGLQSMTLEDPKAKKTVGLEQSTRMSWTPDDDKASFRLSAPQRTNNNLNSTGAECRSTSPSIDRPSGRSNIRSDVDTNPAPTTPDGSNVSVFGSDSLSADSNEVADQANENMVTEYDTVSNGSGRGFNPFTSQVDPQVNQFSAESINSADNNGPSHAFEDTFDVVTDPRVSPDCAAACCEKLPLDVLVAGPAELPVDNAVASPQNTSDDAVTGNLKAIADVTGPKDLNNDAHLCESEELPGGVAVEGLEELEDDEALLVGPANLTNHVHRGLLSSGEKKRAARKKWAHVLLVE